jgi:hypothetical protein
MVRRDRFHEGQGRQLVINPFLNKLNLASRWRQSQRCRGHSYSFRCWGLGHSYFFTPRFLVGEAKNPIRTQGKTPHPQPLSPKIGEGSKVKKMWVMMRVSTPGYSIPPFLGSEPAIANAWNPTSFVGCVQHPGHSIAQPRGGKSNIWPKNVGGCLDL